MTVALALLGWFLVSAVVALALGRFLRHCREASGE